MSTNLLLLHELRVGAVVDDILAEYGGCKDGVDVLGADVLDLAVQDELVALGSEVYGGLFAEKDEGEAVSVLFWRNWIRLDTARAKKTTCVVGDSRHHAFFFSPLPCSP